MREAGVRDLKVHASKILRDVRDRKMRYIITHRGRPVAILAPLEPALQTTLPPGSGDSAWEALVHLGREIGKAWESPMSSADLLSTMRR
jgi:prevent-host-death family protein